MTFEMTARTNNRQSEQLADGKELWNYEIGQGITSSPAVVDNMVVIGSEDGGVYAFASQTRQLPREQPARKTKL